MHHTHVEPCLFATLAYDGFLRRFVRLDSTAREAEATRLLPLLNDEDPALVIQDRGERTNLSLR